MGVLPTVTKLRSSPSSWGGWRTNGAQPPLLLPLSMSLARTGPSPTARCKSSRSFWLLARREGWHEVIGGVEHARNAPGHQRLPGGSGGGLERVTLELFEILGEKLFRITTEGVTVS